MTNDQFAMPMMRGFPCPVSAPMLPPVPGQAPEQGLGVGWSPQGEDGPTFFISVRGADDDVLVAHLGYEEFKRICELLASAGRQALLSGAEDQDDG